MGERVVASTVGFAEMAGRAPAQLLTEPGRVVPPTWLRDCLRSASKRKYLRLKNFVVRRQRTHRGMVELKKIDHFISNTGYVELSWRGILGMCEKKLAGEEHLWSPDFWLDPARKEGMSFVSIDQHFLVSRGLYKTALARYALHCRESDTLYGVKVSRWSVDWEMYRVWLVLTRLCRERQLACDIVPVRTKVSDTLQGNWRAEDYLLTLKCRDSVGDSTTSLGLSEAKEWMRELGGSARYEKMDLQSLKSNALVP